MGRVRLYSIRNKLYIWLTSVNRKPLDYLSRSDQAAKYQNGTTVCQNVIDKTTNTLRAIVQTQDEVSASDMTYFFDRYCGAPEGVEIMLSQESCEVYNLDDHPSLYPVLATALREYAAHSQWEPIIRKLIRRGDDFHAQIQGFTHFCPKCPFMRDYFNCPCVVQACVTPLDEMFRATADPFEARDMGDKWLNILSSEGCDVRAYLEKERMLHTPQSQLITSNRYHPKQLVIELGEIPTVSWRWWYDPSCSAYLFHEEFANWNIHHNDSDPWSRPKWTETWPFEYSKWDDPFERFEEYIPYKGDQMYYEWKEHQDLAQSRAEKRLRKRAAKLGQLGGQEQNPPMPGGWPDEL